MEDFWSPTHLIWIFFIIIAIQPILKRKLIESGRQRMIANIERKENCRIILVVHRQESMSILGIPLLRFLNMEDSEDVLRALESTDPDRNIDIVLHTPGGLALASYQIARAISRCKSRVRVIIPHYAMSGGTLIALAADEIMMSPNAVLGPVDPQLGEFPAPSLLKLKQIKSIDEIEDKTLVLADVAEKATRQLQESIIEIMEPHYEKEVAKNTSKILTEGLWTHDYPITSDKAAKMDLKINTEIPKEYLQLMSMYQQPMRKKSVEYLPN